MRPAGLRPRRARGARNHGRSAGLVVGGALAAAGLLGGCSSDGGPAPTAEQFLTDLEAACAVTSAALDAIPAPPEEISAADFATQASDAWRDEAERLRDLEPPSELDADHRALIRNDEEQAAAWTDLAAATSGTDSDAITELTTTIAQLNLGRSDLVTEIGAPGCARVAG